jgi:hypothetical protein
MPKRDVFFLLIVLGLLALPAMAEAPKATFVGGPTYRMEKQLQRRESWVEDERKRKKRRVAEAIRPTNALNAASHRA